MNFVNTDDDHAAEKPIWGLAGWSSDGRSVLLYDKYDVWRLPLDGRKGRESHGRRRRGAAKCVLRLARADGRRRWRTGRRADSAAAPRGGHGIDLSKPQTLTAYGEWTKKSGYWQLPAGAGAETADLGRQDHRQAPKAEHADRVIFTEQTFQEFPDYWVSDATSRRPGRSPTPTRNLRSTPGAAGCSSTSRTARGRSCRARSRCRPATEPGKKYPMVVYFYEILSNTHHEFSMPVYDDRPHMCKYASNGYLVFEPDSSTRSASPASRRSTA